MKLLLAGSDFEIASMTQRILRRKYTDITCAIGKEETFEQLQHGRFDLVILDHDMSESDCRAIICAAKLKAHVPLLVISSSQADEIPLLEAGADDWLQKPYQVDVLLARIASLLRYQTYLRMSLRQKEAVDL